MAIKSIDQKDVSKITSGQVIIDLKSIVKELVENSIDANSTKIEINFQNYGIDSISVTDNGKGIKKEDFEFVCLRSHTSKISEFEDLDKLSTLGFRGEALNSICSVSSKVKIVTCTDYPKNHELDYDKAGKLSKSVSKIGGGFSKQTGTSVSIEKIFFDLPVRLKNFVKNSKREFHKAINFLTQYLLIYPEIKFSVFNVVNSKKSLALSSRGGSKSTILDNMITVFGANGAKGLVELKLLISEDIQIEGYISSYSFGLGRLVTDRQFMFINKRPVMLKKLSKIVNDVYKSFNHMQYPIFILNIAIDPLALDVNLTPDKGMIMIHLEQDLFEKIRLDLIGFFESQDNVIPRNLERHELNKSTFTKREKKPSVQNIEPDSDIEDIKLPLAKEMGESSIATESDTIVQESCASGLDNIKEHYQESNVVEDGQEHLLPEHEESLQVVTVVTDPETSNIDQEQRNTFELINKEREQDIGSPDDDEDQPIEGREDVDTKEEGNDQIIEDDSKNLASSKYSPINTLAPEYDDHRKNYQITQQKKCLIRINEQEFEESHNKRLKIDMLHNRVESANSHAIVSSIKEEMCHTSLNNNGNRSLKLLEIQDDQSLSYTILRKDFLKMKLIGQFNLGFILVTLDDNNLFIIDQHASDEKYNFERLNQELSIKIQRLIVPQTIELSIIDELLVIEHEQIFMSNGYQFTVVLEAKPGSRIRLNTMPSSRGVVFDLNDFQELINLVNTNPRNKNLKCSKIRNLLAMRACRSSIMIGQPLTRGRMTKVVQNLSQLDKPWNCPHGRPTMRHLVEFDHWRDNRVDYEI